MPEQENSPKQLKVSYLLQYFCPVCNEEATGDDSGDLKDENKFKSTVKPWKGKCGVCDAEVQTPQIIILAHEPKSKEETLTT